MSVSTYKNVFVLSPPAAGAGSIAIENSLKNLANAYHGAWSGAVAYLINDIVISSGVTYICILGHTNHAPPNGTYWDVLAGTGTVSSIAISVPGILVVGGSPITTSGTIALTLATQAANKVWCGPTTGAATAPTFRSLVAADIPNIAESQVTGLPTALATLTPLTGIQAGGSVTGAIALDPSLGATTNYTFIGDVTLSVGAGTVDGQKLVIRIKQDGTGSRILTWGGSNIRFGTTITATTLTATASKQDVITLLWDATATKWDVVALVKGF